MQRIALVLALFAVVANCQYNAWQSQPWPQPQYQQQERQYWPQEQQYQQQPRQLYYQQRETAQWPMQNQPQFQHQFPQPQYQMQHQLPQPQYHMQTYYNARPAAVDPTANRFLQNEPKRAIVKLVGDTVNGNVTFTEVANGVNVRGTVIGLPAGKYGFHVHEKGDITGGCLSAGAHFNPHMVTHGAPEDDIRHVGDLGNLESNFNRIAVFDFDDSVIALTGVNSIIGRTVVVHSAVDDLGKTNHPDSKKTGNAGSRVSCGVIGVLSGFNSSSAIVASKLLLITSIMALMKLF